ncbi:hypothetical protein [Empedobacter sedimenti]|uniref:hypothetical protein n=1 Tax=Empedobacter sedimenti TaxID=3042610 RepID=UPI0024A743C0|nr:hypothetical protein [Empedobacter sedimenti]
MNKIQSYQNMEEMKINSDSKPLILVPHADDEWIGNSQILLKKNATVYYFQFLGNNYNETNKQVRLSELKNLQKEVSFDLIVSSSYDEYSDLEKLVSTNEFTEVYIPFPIDWHLEHIKVNTIFQSILSQFENNIKLYFYHISVPFPSNIKGSFITLTQKELLYKQDIFSKVYKSQYNTPISRLNYQARLNAKEKEIYACENYAELSYEEWTDLLKFVEENYSTKIKPLINYIDDLVLIREKSNQVYLDWKLNK